jgi:hypothetical protein
MQIIRRLHDNVGNDRLHMIPPKCRDVAEIQPIPPIQPKVSAPMLEFPLESSQFRWENGRTPSIQSKIIKFRSLAAECSVNEAWTNKRNKQPLPTLLCKCSITRITGAAEHFSLSTLRKHKTLYKSFKWHVFTRGKALLWHTKRTCREFLLHAQYVPICDCMNNRSCMDTSHETSENNYHEHTGPWSKGTEQVSCTAQSQSSSSAQMDKHSWKTCPHDWYLQNIIAGHNLTSFKLVVSLHLPNGIIYGIFPCLNSTFRNRQNPRNKSSQI